VGVEALCRCNDAKGRPASPAQFIPAAEHTGAIIAVGREVLRVATTRARETARAQGEGLTLSVNVSPVQLNRPRFIRDLEALVGPSAERRHRLCIEITGQLQALRSLGCDVGQGYCLGRPTEASAVDWGCRAVA